MSAKRTIALAGALVISAILGGTLMSAVAAAPQPAATEPATSAVAPAAPAGNSLSGKYCTAYRATLAKELGVTEDALRAAARSAASATIDAALAAGDLSEAAAGRLKTRLDAAADTDLCQTLAGWRAKLAKATLGIARDALTAAADTLGMTPADLRDQLRDGADLQDIAAAKGVPYATVTDAVLDAVRADLDAAVTAGTISAAREEKILERLADRLADGRLRPAR